MSSGAFRYLWALIWTPWTGLRLKLFSSLQGTWRRIHIKNGSKCWNHTQYFRFGSFGCFGIIWVLGDPFLSLTSKYQSKKSPYSYQSREKKSSALLAQEFSICKIYVDSQTTRTLILGSASSDAGSFTVYTLLINIYILIMIHPKRGKPILNQLSVWRRGDIYHSIRLLKIWRCTGVKSRNKDIYLSHIIKDLKPSSGPPSTWTFQVLYTPSSTL